MFSKRKKKKGGHHIPLMKKMKTEGAKIKIFKLQESVRYLTQKNNNGEALIL
jgi:hypothetical protein